MTSTDTTNITSDKPLSPRAALQRRTPAERAAAAPKDLKLAIAAFCFRCQGNGKDGPHRTKARVRDCEARDCELFPHRGWQSITTGRTSDPYSQMD